MNLEKKENTSNKEIRTWNTQSTSSYQGGKALELAVTASNH